MAAAGLWALALLLVLCRGQQQHLCAQVLQPQGEMSSFGINPFWPFSTVYGRQGCCLLDRAVKAMQLMSSLHTCAVFHDSSRTAAATKGGHRRAACSPQIPPCQ